MTSGLDPFLLEILVDPEDKEPLFYIEQDDMLYNPRLHRSYAVRNGIPILLIDEAIALSTGRRIRAPAEARRRGRDGQATERLVTQTVLPVANGAIDSQSMFEVTAKLPDYLDEGRKAARGKKGLPDADSISSIVVLGMGGSGVAGEVLEAWGAPALKVPVVLGRRLRHPGICLTFDACVR